jgi:hypothetical protein
MSGKTGRRAVVPVGASANTKQFEDVVIPTAEDREGNRIIPLSDGGSLDVRRLKVGLFMTFNAFGKTISSTSDLPRFPAFDRLFGEDDRPISDDEMVEFAECMIARGADPDQKLTEFVESKKHPTKN